jgi:hypothetical protein
MMEVSIPNVTVGDVEKIRSSFPESTARRKSEWKIPVGKCLVTFSVEGPTDKSDAELCQYAIDVLEVAKKHSVDSAASSDQSSP